MKYVFKIESFKDFKKKAEKKKGKIKKGKLAKVKPNNRFRYPVHFQLVWNPRWLVAQGWITNTKGLRELHSWAEYKGNVMDLHFNIIMPSKDYYKMFKVSNLKKFNSTQTRRLLTKFRNYKLGA